MMEDIQHYITFICPQSSPLLLIEPGKGYLFSVVWSPTRPAVIALGTAQGNVLMYDLQVRIIHSHLVEI